VDESIFSDLELEAFTVRRFSFEVRDDADLDGSVEAGIDLSYDFYEHETDESRFRIELDVAIRGGDPDLPVFSLDINADAFVGLPDGASDLQKTVLLTNGVAFLYSTLRGSAASLLNQSPISGFLLPAIDMNRLARTIADSATEEPH
jgi:preprotein translocase subunit SecB